MPEKIRFIVKVSEKLAEVVDTKTNRTICYGPFIADANNIAKAMNVSNSWDPILMTSEMEKDK